MYWIQNIILFTRSRFHHYQSIFSILRVDDFINIIPDLWGLFYCRDSPLMIEVRMLFQNRSTYFFGNLPLKWLPSTFPCRTIFFLNFILISQLHDSENIEFVCNGVEDSHLLSSNSPRIEKFGHVLFAIICKATILLR